MNKLNDSEEIILASTCLLLSIADADNNIDQKESQIISEIIQDFFEIDEEKSKEVIIDAKKDLKDSTDYFRYGNKLNEHFSFHKILKSVNFIWLIQEKMS